MSRRRFVPAVLFVAGMLLLIAACGGTTTTKTVTAAASGGGTAGGSGASLQESFVTVIARVAPEVVQISTSQGLGSGIVFDAKGDMVTNAHVVTGGGPFQVTDSRGRTYRATLVGTFAADDLAVVHAKGASLRSASFADSRILRVGDIVLAIGNPLGLRSSVTNGIISALGRTVLEPSGAALPNAIQTSANINPGNSGGALVNLDGRVIGVPTLAATDPQLGGSAPGIGFAIPSFIVSDIAGQLIKYGHVVNSHRAYLGVELTAGVTGGAVVAAVTRGGPAARAGITPGDGITFINGQSVTTPADLSEALATLEPGHRVTVRITKQNGSHATVKVTLGQYPGGSR
jgi:S1-C subfamily serine protease